jgi:hypothetical protein
MRRDARSLTVLVALVVASAMTPLLESGPAAFSAIPSRCTPAQVTLSATPDQPFYTWGALVHVTVALHNRSAATCSYATGPFSPSFLLTNSADVTVWGSCWFGGGPAPCADYLRHRTLAPGATYRDRLTWDQRTGHPDLPTPAGRYIFNANFPGLSLRTTTSFVLTRPHSATVTLADSGRHYALAVGDQLTVHLLASPLVWTTAVSSDPRVLIALPEMNPLAGLYVFRALAPGTAQVSAVGNPGCYPQCLMASRLFFVTVTVRAP